VQDKLLSPLITTIEAQLSSDEVPLVESTSASDIDHQQGLPKQQPALTLARTLRNLRGDLFL